MKKLKIYSLLLMLIIIFSCSNNSCSNNKNIYSPAPPPPVPVDSTSTEVEVKVKEPKKLRSSAKERGSKIDAVKSSDQDIYPSSSESNTSVIIATTKSENATNKKSESKRSLQKTKRNAVKNPTLTIDDVKIKAGKLVYNMPNEMMEKKTYTIKIRINRDTLDNSIISNLDNPDVSVIKTTKKMEVSIVDPSPISKKSFEIVKSNDDNQLVEDGEYTEWIYNITPLRHGKLNLNIVVSITMDGDKKQVVYFKTLFVKSNPKADFIDFISDNWQWMISTLILPLIIWWWNNRKKKRKYKK